ncbi:MAG TPA: glycosyltransferase [Chloroflexia bacterium]|nr:glycosyltransferase [Chloroflexia bacterium]
MSRDLSSAIYDLRLTKLTIVILNWNVSGLLAGCLRSLPAACGAWWDVSEVVVVDNASTDDSVPMLRRDFPDVRVIELAENTGFAAGNNAGLRASRGGYVLFLNPDTIAQPLSIAALGDYMDNHPDVGIAGPRLLNADGTTQSSRRRFPTLTTSLIESTPLQPLFGNVQALRRFYVLDRSDEEEQHVDWLSGAALMCRRSALEQTGPFDPGYFMFSEEVDLCRRMVGAGWQVAYVPQAQITHYGGGSTDQAVPERHINFNTGKARYLRIHEGRGIGWLVRLYLLATYAAQTMSEGAKWALGHKRDIRGQRISAYINVLGSRLRERARHRRLLQRPVMLITGEFPPAPGGVGDYTCELAQALQASGMDSRVVTPATEHERRTTGGYKRRARVYRVARITLGAVLRALKGARARVAHIQYQTGAYGMKPTVNLLPLLLRSLWGKPVVVTFHDLLVPYLFPKAGPVREAANRLLARPASAAIATNHEDAARLRSWGVREVEVIPIGSNIPNNPPSDFDRDRWRAEHGIGPHTTLVAYFGFLNSTKGLDDLLRALSLLRDRTSDYRLMMVGGGLGSSDPTNRATARALDARADELEVSAELIWTGYLEPPEVSAALLSADMAVLPYADGASFRRGSLLAVLAHGLPVITTTPGTFNRAQAPQFEPGKQEAWPALVDGDNAVLVRPGDVDGLVLAIARVAEDAELRGRLAEGAAQLAPFFSWTRIAEAHRALYRRLSQRN